MTPPPPVLERLWAPWRQQFVTRAPGPGCLFCRLRRVRDDRRHWILHRGAHAFVLLNRYPYNTGHLLVVPNRHVARLDRMPDAELLELMRLADRFIRRLDRVVKSQGYNVGLNLGRSAGAGVPGHLHLHVVPRWAGDTNFMTTIGDSKVIAGSLDALHQLLV